MKAADFIFHRARSVDEAVRYLHHFGGGARILAGGQSLMPMMNMRLLRPAALIDVNSVEALAAVEVRGADTALGAIVRYHTIEFSPVIAARLPLLAAMVRHVGDRQIRNRGTLGGSLVQGDPAAEMPLACLVLNATMRVVGRSGTRDIAAGEFYDGAYAAALEPDEILTEIVFPRPPPHCVFREICRRHNDFAVISVAAAGHRSARGFWSGLRLGLAGADEMPILAPALTARLEGSLLTDEDIGIALDALPPLLSPPSDMRASGEYRAHLIAVHVRRALIELRDSLPA